MKNFIKKKEGNELHTKEEISYFIKNLNSFSQEEIASWLRAVKKNGLSDIETSNLTLAMANSGIILNWDELEPLIDKHSSGGIGDKITFLFAPLIAAYKKKEIRVAKLSGRGLGITGGTIDKLESIQGFKTNLSIAEMKEQIKKIGLAICGANTDLAPADKKLYAIRDVTDTVDSIPLIASSIMSKKIAGGSKNIILDVKFGSGAFMKSKDDAKLLAQTMVSIGKNLNKKIKAVLSNMDEPLGYAIGNSLEIKEALEVLNGKEVNDLVEITIVLAREVIGLVDNIDTDIDYKLKELLLGGEALKKFKEMIIAQGGNTDFSTLKKANYIETIQSSISGYISNVNAQSIGEVVHSLGAGRKEVTDSIDHSVGIVLGKKHGDFVNIDDALFEIHAKKKEDINLVKDKLLNSFTFSQNKIPKLKLIEAIIT
jgi:pyrimidine-nucleoside phosphorylase